MLRLLPLVLGAFAIGAETFMVSGVLPQIAADLGVTAAAAGSLVTIFAIAYAFGSPLIAAATAGVERKRLLIVAISAFALANLVAAFAPNFLSLAAARALLALSAGSFMPAAVAFATALFSAERRGRAIAMIYGGMTAATVIGVPAGTYLASFAGWRAPFFGVAILAALAAIGVADRPAAPAMACAPPVTANGSRSRGGRTVLQMLTLTALALVGPFAINTFLGVLAELALGIGGDRLALVLAFFGVVSFAGSQFGGYAADRWPRERFLAVDLRRPHPRLPVDVDRPAARRRRRRGAAVRRPGAVGPVRLGVPDRPAGASRHPRSRRWRRSRCRSTSRRSTSASRSARRSAPGRSRAGRSTRSASSPARAKSSRSSGSR